MGLDTKIFTILSLVGENGNFGNGDLVVNVYTTTCELMKEF